MGANKAEFVRVWMIRIGFVLMVWALIYRLDEVPEQIRWFVVFVSIPVLISVVVSEVLNLIDN